MVHFGLKPSVKHVFRVLEWFWMVSEKLLFVGRSLYFCTFSYIRSFLLQHCQRYRDVTLSWLEGNTGKGVLPIPSKDFPPGRHVFCKKQKLTKGHQYGFRKFSGFWFYSGPTVKSIIFQSLILKCEHPSHMNDSFMRSKKTEIKACIDVILMFGVDVSAALMKPLTLREIIHFDRQQSFLTLSEIRGLSYISDQRPACSGFPHGLYGWIRNQCQSFNNIVYAFCECCLLLCGYFWC